MARVKNYESCIVQRETGEYMVLSDHTTRRAALNAMAFRAFFADPKFVFRVRDKKTGEWVTELSR
jgi:hypothetical protein